ncbi:MAG: hypothetical protein DHS20C02_20660 [Micavibrio sp.]|nr:MAG: hypothetical protein DHS20C02_20660 [Micavibrio sp.]
MDKAVAEQEEIFFDKNRTGDNLGTPWPRGADIIEINRDSLLVNGEMPEDGPGFDKKMTMFFDGQEATTGYAYQGPNNSNNNKVVRTVGSEYLLEYSGRLSNLLAVADQSQARMRVTKRLKELIRQRAESRPLELEKMDEILRYVKDLKSQQDSNNLEL